MQLARRHLPTSVLLSQEGECVLRLSEVSPEEMPAAANLENSKLRNVARLSAMNHVVRHEAMMRRAAPMSTVRRERGDPEDDALTMARRRVRAKGYARLLVAERVRQQEVHRTIDDNRACDVCGGRRNAGSKVCRRCRGVADLVRRHDDLLYLVVDGAFAVAGLRQLGRKQAGAGLVLVSGSVTGTVIASCACSFRAPDPCTAEYEAIVRGQLWAPNVPVYSDCADAIQIAQREGRRVEWLVREQRKRHHLAHELAVGGRLLALDHRVRSDLFSDT